LHIGKVPRSFPFGNYFNLLRIYSKTITANDKAEELSFGNEEFILRNLYKESNLSELKYYLS
jgi:hypothetical protein